MNHTAPQGSILGTDFPVGDINVEACEVKRFTYKSTACSMPFADDLGYLKKPY